jgi:hypothetical protein
VPVPADRSRTTPFVVLERAWLVVWVGLPLALLAIVRVRRRRGATGGGYPAGSGR